MRGTMQDNIWQYLLSLETRDVITEWHKKITGRELSARRAREIISAAKQGREFFSNAQKADTSVKSLLSFYGVSSLSRATLLLLKSGPGEESLKQGHGLTTVNWTNVLNQNIGDSISSLDSLKVRTTEGLFTDFLRESKNRMCLHVRSSTVDWVVPYDVPACGHELSLGELLSRLPDIGGRRELGIAPKSAAVNLMNYSRESGFTVHINRQYANGIDNAYSLLGYEVSDDGINYILKASTEIFEKHSPQYAHTFVNKNFGAIPALYLVEPLSPDSRYSQIALTFILSYFLGMLTRYFPTHWVSLFSGEKGDRLWPAISSAQKYVDAAYPEMALELISFAIDRANNGERW